jgi:hypothetical protein
MHGMIMRDLYGNGVWKVFVPVAPKNMRVIKQQHSWVWDVFEHDAVCLNTGVWLSAELDLETPPHYMDTEERIVVFHDTFDLTSLMSSLDLCS